MDGAAGAETTYTPFQGPLIVRRVKPTPGSQLALFATYSYHGFITDRGDARWADHRRHAEIENAWTSSRPEPHAVGPFRRQRRLARYR